jgi:hypothetical protein
MSDPRYSNPPPSDSRYPGPRQPLDPVGVPVEDEAGLSWGWISAIGIVVVLLGLMIGYHEMGPVASDTPRQITPTTTGAAPPAPVKPPLVNQAAPEKASPPAPERAPQ